MNHKPYSEDYPPPDFYDPVIEAYKKGMDRTLLIENLRRPVEERWARYEHFIRSLDEIRGIAMRKRRQSRSSGELP